jgi:hypothetical protein
MRQLCMDITQKSLTRSYTARRDNWKLVQVHPIRKSAKFSLNNGMRRTRH